ncbi:unnamed protein product [Sphenostylis stenocarpa]|uniref:Uncharacterized protein n=1 Tax=Sphenostylis stenocarpa TaxID=92480 RepID=A0AA86SL47_9FABA|nr:unnamed protein product [Sphenostylis stenocarpa]
MFPRSTHETFAEKLYQTFKDNKRFSKPKLSRTDFTINHYAGDVSEVHFGLHSYSPLTTKKKNSSTYDDFQLQVTYQTDFFLDKNKDYVVPEHAALLSASKCPFVSGLFPPLPEETTKSTKFSSIATQFKLQLQSLLETLNATEPHYIRCVKPNNLLKPGIFENNNVLQQLRCGGVMEAIRISCAGYPTRKTFDEFVQRFTILEPLVLKACPDEMTACKRLLDRANLKDYQIGKTKVFLRAGQMAELDACRAEVLGLSASVIQRKARMFLCRKQYILLQFSAVELQRVAKGQLARHQYECMRREAASLKIQKDFRMYISRNAYKSIYATAIYIQTGMRGMAARNELRFRRRTKASIIIQAAREAKALEEAKNNLEKQVKELISCLEEEKAMRGQVNSLERKIDETEMKYEECNRLSEERMNQIIETESKMIEIKTNMQRLEEKVSDMETENQVLRQQTLLSSSSKRMSGKFSPATTTVNTRSFLIKVRQLAQQTSNPAKTFGSEDSKVRRSLMERHQESVEILFKCVTKDLGFSEGKPVAAFTLYNCLLHWKSFEAEKTSIFDRLIQIIGSEIEDPDKNDCMAYWLSNTSSLFFHLHRCLRVPAARKPPTPTSFFGRMAQGFRSSNSLSSSAFDVVHQVDAKYPALLFKQQLAAYVEKIYGIVRENFKTDLSPLLSSCIQADRASNDNSEQAGSWLSIKECLDKYLKIMKENYVPTVLVQKLFNQIFQYINVEIFNSLLLHGECCTTKHGEYIKSGLAELEEWCNEATEEYIGSSLDELKHAIQAVRFLVAPQKDELSYDDLTNDICPVLSAQQLYRICTLYSDDDDEKKQSVSTDVTTRLKLLMTDDDDEDNKSFLMEDNTSHPIIVEEIPTSSQDKNIPKILSLSLAAIVNAGGLSVSDAALAGDSEPEIPAAVLLDFSRVF